MNTVDLEVEGMSSRTIGKHVTQVLHALTGVSGVAINRQSGHVRVIGEFTRGSNFLVSALTEAGYPARLSASSVSMSQPGTKINTTPGDRTLPWLQVDARAGASS